MKCSHPLKSVAEWVTCWCFWIAENQFDNVLKNHISYELTRYSNALHVQL